MGDHLTPQICSGGVRWTWGKMDMPILPPLSCAMLHNDRKGRDGL